MNTETSVEELFKRYSDMVYRIAISYGNNASMAEDVVQEVFVRFLKKAPHLTFENEQHEKAWFIRVAVNCCKSMLTCAWMKRIRPLEEAEPVPAPFCREEEGELYQILASLPAKYRIVLYLRYYEEYSVKEIAELLHVTANTVSLRLLRAKKRMKQEILQKKEEEYNGTEIIQRHV